LYRPPAASLPPQTIICVPVQNPVGSSLAEGTGPLTEVGCQESPAVIVYVPLVTAESAQPD
jgi:hypothetical protein